jgi:DNA-binding transcriptional LysR family regulator
LNEKASATRVASRLRICRQAHELQGGRDRTRRDAHGYQLHAIDAVAAGQGIAICSDVVVSGELKSGALVKAHALSLPGYGFYLVSVPNHPQRPNIEAFSAWMRSVV